MCGIGSSLRSFFSKLRQRHRDKREKRKCRKEAKQQAAPDATSQKTARTDLDSGAVDGRTVTDSTVTTQDQTKTQEQVHVTLSATAASGQTCQAGIVTGENVADQVRRHMILRSHAI